MTECSVQYSSPTKRRLLQVLIIPLVSVAVILSSACEDVTDRSYQPTYGTDPPTKTTQYIFAVHPLHNPKMLHAVYGPLIDHINSLLGIENASLKLEASCNYAAFDEKLARSHFHFALPNPYQTIKSVDHGYVIFGKMDNDDDFCGIILIRNDSPIRAVKDLQGKSVSYPAPTALAATMMPQMYLTENGLNVMKDIHNIYVGSQESSMMSVYLSKSAAGATWPPPWRKFQAERPDIAQDLRVIWRTESLPSNGLVVRKDVPDMVRSKVASILFSLHETPEGRAILQRMPLSRFAPADNATYAPVYRFMERFESSVRRVGD